MTNPLKLVIAALVASVAFPALAEDNAAKAMSFEDFIVDAPDLVGQVVSVPCKLGLPDS